MTDEDFIAALEACTLPQERFRHADHLRAGYLYLRRMGPIDALARMRETIRRYAKAIGADGLYHETITTAFMAVVNERIRLGGDGGGWPGFAAANPDLFDKRFLLHYYRPETLCSARARELFVLGEFRERPYEAAEERTRV